MACRHRRLHDCIEHAVPVVAVVLLEKSKRLRKRKEWEEEKD